MNDGGKKIGAVVADVVFRFQKHPGTDDDAVIDLGDGKLEGNPAPVKTQGKGFYAVKVPMGGELEFEAKGTKWRVVQRSKLVHHGEDADRPMIVSWSKLGDIAKPEGQQQRLEILGYNPGPIDGVVGKRTERAVLGFQTDQQLRSDAIVGPVTQAKFGSVMESAAVHPDATKDYVVRVCPIGFARAPSDDAAATSGPPRKEAPDPDDRGSAKAPSVPAVVAGDTRGTMVSLAKGITSRIKVIRRHLGTKVPIRAESTDASIVEVRTSGVLPSSRQFVVELKGLKAGFADVELRLDKDRAVVLGSLRAVVFDPLAVLVRPYYVGIGSTGPPVAAPVFPARKREFFEKAFAVATNVWMPYGVSVFFFTWRKKTVNLAKAGVMQCNKTDFDAILNAKDSDGKSAPTTVINLLVVDQLVGAQGVTFPTVAPAAWPWPQGIALMANAKGEVTTGLDLAHELGHFFGLSNLAASPMIYHADDDPSSSDQKKDMWSIRQLMYSGWPPASPAHRHDVGYGPGNYGALVSLRDNPGDRTDGECEIVRKTIGSGSFYKSP